MTISPPIYRGLHRYRLTVYRVAYALVYQICYVLAGRPEDAGALLPNLTGYRKKGYLDLMTGLKRKRLRRTVLERDRYVCQYCGRGYAPRR